jgi:hypothetical protein
MTIRVRRMATAALAALTLTTAFAATSAQAGDYGRPAYDRLGSADPCRREAGNRALTWGVLGLLAGATAGGAAAGAGVVAEGAWLGGVVGGVIGAKAGAASAACGTARDPYAYWNHPSYRASTGQGPSPYYADEEAVERYDDDYAYRDERRYDDRSSYAYDSRYDDRRYVAPRPCDCHDSSYGYGHGDRYGASSYSRSSSSYDDYKYDRSESSYTAGSVYDLPPVRYYDDRR